MLKRYKDFINESKPAYIFKDSEEYDEVIEKWGFKDEDINDYFEDLKDDNIDVSYLQGTLSDENDKNLDSNSFTLIVVLAFTYKVDPIKEVKSPYGSKYDMESYKRFLDKQKTTVEKIEKSTERFISGESLKLLSKYVSKVPFHMTQNHHQNLIKINYRLSIKIESSDLYDAIKKYKSKDNPIAKAKDEIVNVLIEKGILPEYAERLIDVHPGYQDMEETQFGFMTDGEIITVASIVNGELIFNDFRIREAINAFYDGYCEDVLEDPDYIDKNLNG
jgi:hypothetical protein